MNASVPRLLQKAAAVLSTAALLVVAPACTGPRSAEGQGETQSQARTVGDFTRIRLDMPARVVVHPGTACSVELIAQPNLQDLIDTHVEGQTLVCALNQNLVKSKEITFHVSTPSLDAVRISGPGTVEVLYGFSPKELTLDLSGPGLLQGNFAAGLVEAKVGGPGRIQLSGSAKTLRVDNAGVGHVDALNMPVATADIRVAGPGDVSVHADEELAVNISGPGVVRYRGTPTKKTENVTGHGRLVQL